MRHALLAIAIASSVTSCLPGDTRPVPQRVEVTVEPGQALAQGITTADGWSVSFDRFLFAIGNAGFVNDDTACNSYAEARYDRLYDFAVIGDRQKVGTVYGLGTCRMEFRLRSPSFDVLLGPGATQEDVTFMREEATDRYAEEDPVSLLAIGAATRGQETKRFEWAFRRSYEYTDCQAEGGGFVTTVKLTTAATSELRIEVRPEELFRAADDDSAELLFQPIADADGDADGVITFLELSKVPPPVVEGGAGGGGGASAADAGASPTTLEGLIYERLLPRVLRIVGGGPCSAELRGRR